MAGVRRTADAAVPRHRPAPQDPLLFQRIRASYAGVPWEWDEPEALCRFLQWYTRCAWGDLEPHSAHSAHSAHGGDGYGGGGQGGGGQGGGSAAAGGSAGGGERVTERGKFGRVKRVVKYLFASVPELQAACAELLRVQPNAGAILVLVATALRVRSGRGGHLAASSQVVAAGAACLQA